MVFAITHGQKVLFTGDSIEECGRRTISAPIGEGYVRMVHDLISARYPAHQVTVLNTGVPSHTVRDLFNRATDVVIRHQPDWISIKIGANDIIRTLRKDPESAVSPEEYAHFYDALLARIRAQTHAEIVLVDPFFITTHRGADSWRKELLDLLPRYQKVVSDMVRKYQTRHVRLHSMFQKQLHYSIEQRWCAEPVHPNHSGHLLLAYEWLKVMGW